MKVSSDPSLTRQGTPEEVVSHFRTGVELLLISFLILFLELACIRWFPAHVLFLTFFTNTVLLASFLGMSVGCLAASHHRHYLSWTPLLLAVALAVAHLIEIESATVEKMLDVGHQVSPQLVFFGTEYRTQDLARFAVPVELLCGLFFLIIALLFIGLGQQLGRSLKSLPHRVQAYTLNILGSIVGILSFAACSWLELSPFWWFLIVVIGLGYFYYISRRRRFRTLKLASAAVTPLLLLTILWLAGYAPDHDRSQAGLATEQFWSPYYRIDFAPQNKSLSVNLVYHQQMVSRDERFPAYALPYLLNRDAGRPAFRDVLIIGAGSGNDVSRALQWGAEHVDAVEIDPAIYRLGLAHHPDHPYSDSRVQIHLDDGRNFLRSTERKYDLIVYALVDSLVLHSGYSNIRLESYLFTRQTFDDVRAHLKAGGEFVIYNYFRQGWIVARLQKGLDEAFGAGNSLVLTLPYRQTIEAEKSTFGDFTIFFAGETAALRDAFTAQTEYWLPGDRPPGPNLPNGFKTPDAQERARLRPISDNTQQEQQNWRQFGLARIIQPEGGLRAATDDWPFLYLRGPMIPGLSLRGMAVMGLLSLLLILLFQSRDGRAGIRRWTFNGQMFFLGAGFMLIETKAVVLMALLFGSTWIVNSVVFFAVLLMILAANLWTIKLRPGRLWPYYAGLFLTLAINSLIPLDSFLGMPRSLQVIGSCLLVFAPVFFAGVVFVTAFKRTVEPDRAFGANIAGAIMGGLAEYSSMLLGFQYLALLAILFYILSALAAWRQNRVMASDPSMDSAISSLADPVSR